MILVFLIVAFSLGFAFLLNYFCWSRQEAFIVRAGKLYLIRLGSFHRRDDIENYSELLTKCINYTLLQNTENEDVVAFPDMVVKFAPMNEARIEKTGRVFIWISYEINNSDGERKTRMFRNAFEWEKFIPDAGNPV